ncbi:MAG: hypothetical protein M9958_11765 [Chitinophagales bacterium]|nr:hypothetical protein [Chitinophagales bacterium]
MLKIYHYNKCSKSREALCILEDKSTNFTVRYYIDNPLNKEEIIALQKKLNLSLIDMIRTNEAEYKSLFLDKQPNENQLIDALLTYPKLLQRPIVEMDDSAIIARPPEKIFEFIK